MLRTGALLTTSLKTLMQLSEVQRRESLVDYRHGSTPRRAQEGSTEERTSGSAICRAMPRRAGWDLGPLPRMQPQKTSSRYARRDMTSPRCATAARSARAARLRSSSALQDG